MHLMELGWAPINESITNPEWYNDENTLDYTDYVLCCEHWSQLSRPKSLKSIKEHKFCTVSVFEADLS